MACLTPGETLQCTKRPLKGFTLSPGDAKGCTNSLQHAAGHASCSERCETWAIRHSAVAGDVQDHWNHSKHTCIRSPHIALAQLTALMLAPVHAGMEAAC